MKWRRVWLTIAVSTSLLTIVGCENERNPVSESETGALISRIVLAEIFESDGCPRCANAAPALERLQREATPDSLLILEYHINDDLALQECIDRALSLYNVEGVPTVLFDGFNQRVISAITQEEAYKHYRQKFNAEIGRSPLTDCQIHSSYTISGDQVIVTAEITNVSKDYDYEDLTLNFIIYEDIDTPENYHHFVVRDILPGEVITSFQSQSHHQFQSISADLSETDLARIGIVVFVQDENADNKDVLQAAKATLTF